MQQCNASRSSMAAKRIRLTSKAALRWRSECPVVHACIMRACMCMSVCELCRILSIVSVRGMHFLVVGANSSLMPTPQNFVVSAIFLRRLLTRLIGLGSFFALGYQLSYWTYSKTASTLANRLGKRFSQSGKKWSHPNLNKYFFRFDILLVTGKH